MTGPLEVFAGANAAARRERARSRYESATLSAGGAPVRTLERAADHARRLARAGAGSDRHADRARRSRRARGRGRRGAARVDRRRLGRARGARHRSAPARSCSPRAGLLDGRRATTHWVCRRARSRGASARRGRRRADLRPRRHDLDFGRRDCRHGPRARAGRAGPRPRCGAGDRAASRAVPAPARQPVAVQRDARGAAAARASRCARSSAASSRTSPASTPSRRWRRERT